MIPELEKAVRAIVRDELRALLGSYGGDADYKIHPMPIREKMASGRIQNMVIATSQNGAKKSTTQIAEETSDATTNDRGTHKHSIRNAVFSMHKHGMLIRDTTTPEWTYSLPTQPIEP